VGRESGTHERRVVGDERLDAQLRERVAPSAPRKHQSLCATFHTGHWGALEDLADGVFSHDRARPVVDPRHLSERDEAAEAHIVSFHISGREEGRTDQSSSASASAVASIWSCSWRTCAVRACTAQPAGQCGRAEAAAPARKRTDLDLLVCERCKDEDEHPLGPGR